MTQEKILVLDFGGQYDQLIARRVRDLRVYAELQPYNKITVEEIKAEGYKGIIFTGGPNSVYDPASPITTRRCWTPASPSWASATVTSCWRGWRKERSVPPAISPNTAK